MFNHVAQPLSKTYGIQKQTSPLIWHTSYLHTLSLLQDILTYPASPTVVPVMERSDAPTKRVSNIPPLWQQAATRKRICSHNLSACEEEAIVQD